jgi:phosphoglycolate phosphatase
MNETLRHVRAVAFDLDGTLVDSAPDIQHALNAALGAARLQCFDLDLVRAWIGDGPDVLIARALAHQGLDGADDELRTRLRGWFDTASLAAPLAGGRVYPGIAELLGGLHPMLPMVVVTNKPTVLARAVLQAANVLPVLDGVHGADTPALRKPSPGMLLAAAAELRVEPHELLMVGDSAPDMQAAQAAGCHALLVTWGYGHRSLPGSLDPVRIDAPAELLHALRATRSPAPSTVNS